MSEQQSHTSIGELTFRNITIRIADTVIPMKVDRTEEAEAKVRNAATIVNRIYSEYQALYPSKSSYDHMIFTALHLAVEQEGDRVEQEELQLEARMTQLLRKLEQLSDSNLD